MQWNEARRAKETMRLYTGDKLQEMWMAVDVKEIQPVGNTVTVLWKDSHAAMMSGCLGSLESLCPTTVVHAL